MDRHDIKFSAADDGLRRDVGELGALVGDALREQGGDALFERVEALRTAAIRRREGDRAAERELEALTDGLDAAVAADLVRAFSTYFQVVNLAERVHRIRRRREYQRTQAGPQPGGVEAALVRMRDAGVDAASAARIVARARFEPVFTAHPTEATRRTLLEKQQRIARALIERLDPTLTPEELRRLDGQMRAEVTAAWQTDEHPDVRMTVADELEHVLFYLTDVIYRVAPAFIEGLHDAFQRVYGEPLPADCMPLRFASWVGGDMDGNPNVGAETFTAALAEHERLVLALYRSEVRELARRLSQSVKRVGASDALRARLDEYARMLPDVDRDTPPRHRDMPYRRLLRFVGARLAARSRGGEHAYAACAEFAADITLISDSLRAHRGEHAGLFAVERLRCRIALFGFHLAALDMRQEAGALHDGDAQTTAAVTALRDAVADDPARAGTFIVSMAREPADVLRVLELADGAPLDVAPLFETVDDLEYAPTALRALFADTAYRTHVARRGDRQVVMLGYSDSNKDGGLAAARWALYRCQQQLVEVQRESGIELLLFHGRGGTTSRGGGKIGAAVRAAPAGSLTGHLRVTEQGEMINTKYGLRGIAARTFDQALGAIIGCLHDDAVPRAPEAEWVVAMDTLAAASRAAYRALVFDDPRFQQFFRDATPIDVIERMMIGSRPSRRGGAADASSLRAIPWVFAWTQTRLILPGWYGLGAGLAAARERHGDTVLRAMLADWPFFRALLDDAGMVLAKADLEIGGHYATLAGPGARPVYDVIAAEFGRTRDALVALKGATTVLDDDPVLQRSIRLRNPYVDPMSLLQVDLLRRWRAGGREDDALFEALLASVNGIAQGLQNTG